MKTVFKILKALFFRRKEYDVSFTKEENGRWYVDFPGWPLSHDNLEMVAGADDLLDYLSMGHRHIQLRVRVSNNDIPSTGVKLTKDHSRLTQGAFYNVVNGGRTKRLWLCPVTLCVLGRYPKYIIIETHRIN